MDWASSIPASKEELRASVDLATVVAEELGVTMSVTDGQGHCPFHDDTRPSFAVFESEDGVERAGCWACGWRGDAFDVIQAARLCSFSDAMRILRDYQGRAPAVQRQAETIIRDFSTELKEARRRYEMDPSPVRHFVQTKGYPWTADWLRREFHVGVASSAGRGSVFIPHLTPDGGCTGYKHRTAYTPPMSAGGSRFPHLYGCWRDRDAPVVVTEGESDTWAVTWHVPEVVAFGLPTGAAAALRSEWLTVLAEREVTVCFDGDAAGREAAKRWRRALPVRIIELPEEVDCVGMGRRLRPAILVG